MTLFEALTAARQKIDRLDARLLLQHATGCSHSDLLARPETPVAAPAYAQFIAWVERRAAGEPLAYLVGEAEFRGRVFQVSPAVLIPRPETEVLIDLALERLHGLVAPRVLDLGTGSGIVAISLALECPAAQRCCGRRLERGNFRRAQQCRAARGARSISVRVTGSRRWPASSST